MFRYQSIAVLTGILCLSLIVSGQTKVKTDVSQTWLGYFNQSRFSDRWGIWADLHLRTKEDLLKDLSQGIVRLGITYYLNNETKLTAGYAFVNHYPAEGHLYISQPEHRPWQQLQWHTRYERLRLMQWIRVEERFRRKIKDNYTLADGYRSNLRFRYNFFAAFALSKKPFAKGTVSWIINDELHINAGKEIVYNTFDQNRFFTGVSYQLNPHDNLQLGYMNLYQQLAPGNSYRTIHALRIFFFQNLDLRPKKAGS